MRRLAILSIVVAMALVLQAHEFWMAPSKYYYSPGESLSLNFRVGEDFIGEAWKVKKERFERFEVHREKSMEDIRASLKADEPNALTYALPSEGTHLVVMQTNHVFSELEGEKFNAYLKEDALDEAYAYRRKNNQLDKPGRELYARYSKMIIQVGSKVDDGFKKSAGLPIEIFVEQNPATLNVGSKVSFKVMFEGKPLFGARVSVWNRHNNRTTRQPIFTQQDGRIETHISNPGPWMVSVVKMVQAKDPKADWESYWGSLTFGVK
ncbi:MAG TPA: DUF4198 domain-containing protein [Chryseosolibacter sp.]